MFFWPWRRRRATEQVTCSVCCERKRKDLFPFIHYSSHRSTACATCIQRQAKEEINGKQGIAVRCPERDCALQLDVGDL